eukprot:TRINITY_DN7598_c0_g1_i1.p1 TRINITY_DN7598_c0_g1~~TRINITY_DN7598_c0_g1_i1.p1  ORF type:complete len:647 (+),score=127.67 TRINITY_DN7598_c0_g1_i1:57-1997(+)
MEVMTEEEKWLKELFDREEPINLLVQRAKEIIGSVGNLLVWLDQYRSSLDTSLHQVIQDNYHSFFLLHEKNQELYDHIHMIRPLLIDLKVSAEGIKSTVVEGEAVLEGKLEEYKLITMKKKIIKLFRQITKLISKLEELLSRSIKNMDFSDQVVYMERVSHLYNQLIYYLSEGKNYPFAMKASSQISMIELTIKERMEHILIQAFESKSEDVLISCLRAYTSINCASTAEDIYRDNIVENHCLDLFKREPATEYHIILSSILEYIQNECYYLLELTKDFPQYNFLGRAIWPKFEYYLGSKQSKIFSPAFPDLFAENYHISMDFLTDMEEIFIVHKKYQEYRNHGSYKGFMKRWNLAVYFQLRRKEIVTKIENTIQKPLYLREDLPIKFEVTEMCSQLLETCWKEYYLYPLSHRFFEITLKLIKRYINWINSIDNNDTKFVTAIYSDMNIFDENVRLVVQYIEETQNGSGNYVSVIQSGIESIRQILEEERIKRKQYIIDEIIVKSQRELHNIRSIKAAYFLVDNNQVADQPMPYVKNVLSPILGFEHIEYLQPDEWKVWVLDLLKELFDRYKIEAQNLLETARNREQFISNISQSSDNKEKSDVQKMDHQLLLDVTYINDKLDETLGIQANQFEGYKNLILLLNSN